MEQHRIPKKVLGSRFGGGRPDIIQRDTANLIRIPNRKAAARDKGEWRKKVGRPWPENGPKRHRRRKKESLSYLKVFFKA
jgi:hypothetical protein